MIFKRTSVIAASCAAALALGPIATAEAATWTGRIQAYIKATEPTQYQITLTTGGAPWVWANTYFVSCTGAGISDGSLISMTRLGQVKSSGKTIRIYTSAYPTSITCL